MAIITNPIHIFSKTDDLFQFAAHDFRQRALAAVAEKGLFSVVLSGGKTPKLLFDALIQYKKNMPWSQIQFFFGDERYLPSDDPENNFHMAKTYLFSKLPIDPENIYPIPTEFSDPKEAAKAYQALLKSVFHLKGDALPEFDLVYLGLGDNAHTASLMPLSDVVMRYMNRVPDHDAWVTSLFFPEGDLYRITLTPPIINNAKTIIFVVTGANKAMAVEKVIEGPHVPAHYPAQLIQCQQGDTIWLLDQEAAVKLNQEKNQGRTIHVK